MIQPDHAAAALLGAIVGRDRNGYLEVRHKLPNGGWAQEWFTVTDITGAADFLMTIGQTLDAYVGMAPRKQRSGRNTDVTHAWVLSADCDGDAALNALAAFAPPPTFVVASGGMTPDNRRKLHAHWQLEVPVTAEAFTAAKGRLAHALDSDRMICDPARIMRVPGTCWHKHGAAQPVELVAHDPTRRYRAAQVVGHLADLPLTPPRRQRDDDAPAPHDDALKEIPTAEYLADLTGRRPDTTTGKVRCPFHSDGKERTPSLQLYGTTWHCFGCKRGGDIYEAAALRFGYPTTPGGPAFLAIRARLTDYYMKKGATA